MQQYTRPHYVVAHATAKQALQELTMTVEQAQRVADRINETYADSRAYGPVKAIVSRTTMGVYGVRVHYRVGGGYGKPIPAMDAYTTVSAAYNVWPWNKGE